MNLCQPRGEFVVLFFLVLWPIELKILKELAEFKLLEHLRNVSRGGDISLTCWWEECERICGSLKTTTIMHFTSSNMLETLTDLIYHLRLVRTLRRNRPIVHVWNIRTENVVWGGVMVSYTHTHTHSQGWAKVGSPLCVWNTVYSCIIIY